MLWHWPRGARPITKTEGDAVTKKNIYLLNQNKVIKMAVWDVKISSAMRVWV